MVARNSRPPRFDVTIDSAGRSVYHCPGTLYDAAGAEHSPRPCPYTVVDAAGRPDLVTDAITDHWRNEHVGKG